jgi:DNA-binding SARP family transcriptional activator
VEFRILGPFEVRREGRPVHIEGAKERALLVLLLLNAGEPVAVDRLIDELWSESPATARKSVQVRVAGLRRALGGDVVATRGDAYLLRLEPDQLDLRRFEELLADANEAGEPRAAIEILDEALALWRGPPLADFAYESFAQPAIARLEDLRVHAHELRIDAQLELGLHDRVVPQLEDLVARHPLRERMRAQLMLALYRDGRQADALEVYRRTRAELAEELGIEPGPQLQQLHQAILRQDASLDAVPQAVHSILVAPQDPERLADLVAIAEPLTQRPRRELILARLIAAGAELGAAAELVDEHRSALIERGVSVRAVAFTTADPGADLVRVAVEQDVDLVLLDGAPHLDGLWTILERAPCDVAVYVGRDEPSRHGPVLVLFAGGENDWSAVELGAWMARAQNAQLRLAGPAEGKERDASRALASVSLAVQRVLGVAAEPVLLAPAPPDVLAAAEEAAVVVMGVPERARLGLGRVREAVAAEARPPALLVRRGLRPGGLAPRRSMTRFSWTLGPAA